MRLYCGQMLWEKVASEPSHSPGLLAKLAGTQYSWFMLKDKPGPPIWMRHLDRVRRECPSPNDSRFRETLALAELGWRQFLARLRYEDPDASDQELQDTAYRTLSQWQRVRSKLRFRSDS